MKMHSLHSVVVGLLHYSRHFHSRRPRNHQTAVSIQTRRCRSLPLWLIWPHRTKSYGFCLVICRIRERTRLHRFRLLARPYHLLSRMIRKRMAYRLLNESILVVTAAVEEAARTHYRPPLPPVAGMHPLNRNPHTPLPQPRLQRLTTTTTPPTPATATTNSQNLPPPPVEEDHRMYSQPQTIS